jgi:hypothetical protein
MDLLPESKDRRKTNLVWDEKLIKVENFRDQAEKFQLDTHGFATRRLPRFEELLDKDTITQKYIPAVKDMLQTELHGVGTVFVFDWRVRQLDLKVPSVC